MDVVRARGQHSMSLDKTVNVLPSATEQALFITQETIDLRQPEAVRN